MSDITVKVFQKEVDLPLPSYKTATASGMDLPVSEDGEILPGQRKLLPTGLYLEIPDGYEAQVRPRSGLAIHHGITMLNAPGTIDSDYRGEIQVILYNSSDRVFKYRKGDRIAQIVFAKIARAGLEVTESLSATGRGDNGFGSTGV